MHASVYIKIVFLCTCRKCFCFIHQWMYNSIGFGRWVCRYVGHYFQFSENSWGFPCFANLITKRDFVSFLNWLLQHIHVSKISFSPLLNCRSYVQRTGPRKGHQLYDHSSHCDGTERIRGRLTLPLQTRELALTCRAAIRTRTSTPNKQ